MDIYDIYRMSPQYELEEESARLYYEKREIEQRIFERYEKLKKIKSFKVASQTYRKLISIHDDDVPF